MVLKRVKVIQLQAAKTWKGMNVDFIGRPGIYQVMNTNKKFEALAEYQKIEDERFRYFLEGINKYKEIEEEKLLFDINYPKQ